MARLAPSQPKVGFPSWFVPAFVRASAATFRQLQLSRKERYRKSASFALLATWTLNGKCSTFGLMKYTVRPTYGRACLSGWMNVGGGYCRKNGDGKQRTSCSAVVPAQPQNNGRYLLHYVQRYTLRPITKNVKTTSRSR